MEMIYPKKKYNISDALAHAIRNHGDKNILSVVEAGDKELNHIIEIVEEKR